MTDKRSITQQSINLSVKKQQMSDDVGLRIVLWMMIFSLSKIYFAKMSNLDHDLSPNNMRAQSASRTLTTCRVSIKRSPWHKLFPRSWPYANPHRWTLQCRDETFIFVSRSKTLHLRSLFLWNNFNRESLLFEKKISERNKK